MTTVGEFWPFGPHFPLKICFKFGLLLKKLGIKFHRRWVLPHFGYFGGHWAILSQNMWKWAKEPGWRTWVGRFFLVQHTKTGKIHQISI
jgi:hypothetical protein